MKKIIFLLLLWLAGCAPKPAAVTGDKGLKDYYSSHFPVGVAVSAAALERPDERALILREFNSLTPENAMKMGPIHPAPDRYYWEEADKIAAFAREHNMKLRGHTLCWHNQTPDWFFKDGNGQLVSKEVLLTRLKEHITTVVNRYKGTIYAWDVVNEAISDKQDEYLRPSLFYQICGEEYIEKAFEYAHAADPDALLFYNDYNEISSVKRKKIHRLVKGLLDKGVPVHGIGLQAHWAVNEPDSAQLQQTLLELGNLGLPLQITELDVSVYPKEHNARDRRPEDADMRFTPERERLQRILYNQAFRQFRGMGKQLTGVTFWNISDRHSWLDDFPVKNRKDYPLLFDTTLRRKPAYFDVINFRGR